MEGVPVLSWILPHAALPFTGSNLYPFTLINHNHGYNSFSGFFKYFLASHQACGCALGDPQHNHHGWEHWTTVQTLLGSISRDSGPVILRWT